MAALLKTLLFKNISSLALIQMVNSFLPLIIIPYLLRIVGFENFGLISFATAIAAYFTIIVDNGFTVSGTRYVAKNKSNIKALNTYFSSVMSIKLCFVFLCFLLLVFLRFMFPNIFTQFSIFLFAFLIVIGNFLFPIWVFQGYEKMFYLAIVNTISRAVYVVLIFTFIKVEEDYEFVTLLNGISYLISGIISLILIKHMFKISLTPVNFENLKFAFNDSFNIFKSRIYAGTYNNYNLIFLGFLGNNLAVGYYAVAEKILKALQNIYQPVLTGFYPFFIRKIREKKAVFFKYFRRLTLSLCLFSSVVSVCIYIFSNEIIYLLSGNYEADIAALLRILCIAIFLSPFGPHYSNGLFVAEKDNFVSKFTAQSLILTLLLSPLLVLYGAIGASISIIIVYISITIRLGREFNNFKKTIYENK